MSFVSSSFKLTDEASVKYDAVSASKLHERVAKSGARLNIMIFDACRNNNFSLSRSGGGGLAAMNAARGSFIVFATAPGRTADDNRRGSNGLFTGFLLEALSTPGLKLDEVFNRVRERTFAASGERQLPWTSSSVIGDFYFIPDGSERDLTFVPNGAEVVPVASPRPHDRYQRVTVDNLTTGQTWSLDIENEWPKDDEAMGTGETMLEGLRARKGDKLRVRYNIRAWATWLCWEAASR